MSTENGSQPVAEVPQAASPDLMQMFLAALAAQSDASRETMLDAIRLMKEPSAEEKAKLESARLKDLENVKRKVAFAQRKEQSDAARRKTCSHRMPNGKTNLRGQINSNGYGVAYCSYCQTLSEPFQATEYERMGGLNLGEWGPNAWAMVQSRVAQSPPPPPIPDAPSGATVMFD